MKANLELIFKSISLLLVLNLSMVRFVEAETIRYDQPSASNNQAKVTKKDKYYEQLPKGSVPLNLDGYLAAGSSYCTRNGHCLRVAPNLPDCLIHPDTQICQDSKIPIKVLSIDELGSSRAIIKIDGHNYVSGAENWTKQVSENQYIGGTIEVVVDGGTIPLQLYSYNLKVNKHTVENHIVPYVPPNGLVGYKTAQRTEVVDSELNQSKKDASNLNIGKQYQGGIIFWLDETGQHGLIAALADQSKATIWPNDTGIDYSANDNGSTPCSGNGQETCYSDWYLPSKKELNLLWNESRAVGGFDSSCYWSSSEYLDNGSNGAWCQSFRNGYQDFHDKSFTHSIRAVRAF